MAEGKSRDQWNHTAAMLAHLVNVQPFRRKGAKLAKPTDFHPFARRRSGRHTPVSVDRLTDEMVKFGEGKEHKRKAKK